VESAARRKIAWLIGIVVAAVIALGGWYWYASRPRPAAATPVVAPAAPPPVSTEPQIAHPIAADNAAGAAPLPALNARDPVVHEAAALVYQRLYPLFQQAYEDLGYPGKYFNDRLVEVIDHLLQAPEVPAPIKLVQPRVFYEYADADLEGRSAGQKLLIRMGPANARAIKAKLREFRAEIAKKK